jgi:putative MFS transporter
MSVKKTAGEVLGSSESQASSEFSWRTLFNGAVVVSALGYFVDIYDLLLFNIVRIPSLRELGLTGQELSAGAFLHNTQMVGMMVGGVLWGVLGDKRGRLSVLFGSIFLYSIANLLNAWVASYEQYAVLRFLAGVGLAGELGAGITLVAESLPSALRGYGTMLVATVGVSGAIVAGWLGQVLHWRTCYGIGGGLGLLLLALRIGVLESGLYEGVLKKANVVRGNFFELFKTRERFVRYLCCILIGIPVWYVIGILVAYSPEFAKALGTSEPVIAAKSVMWCYAGLVAGDLLSGLISQWLKSRLKVVLLFLGLTATSVVTYLLQSSPTASTLYGLCFLLGLGTGYWAVLVTIAVEQFGTNLRATVGTTVPNFVRGSVVPASLLFLALKEPLGIIGSAALVGVIELSLALIALKYLKETFGKSLQFIEGDGELL